MNFFLSIVLISSLIYSNEAGQCHVHNRPHYLTMKSNKNDDSSSQTTVSNFANNLAVILGLSPDETKTKEQPIFYSSRPLEIPSSTWLLHIEGLDRLLDDGITLEDNAEFNIDSIQSKLNKIGNGDDLNIASLIVSSPEDLNNLKDSLQNQIDQMNKEASIKYIVIVCDDCQHANASDQLQKQVKAIVEKAIEKDPQTLAITLTTKETARVRRSRQVKDVSNNITIAEMYSDNYPVMFNLFFWTSLTLALIVLSITYVFLTLDPGADTLIYRMTTPRLKVD